MCLERTVALSATGSADINSKTEEEAPSDTEGAEQASNEDVTPDDREENNQNRTNGRTDSTVGATK
jgi:hypothetical protein